jgi:hypothetical protein
VQGHQPLDLVAEELHSDGELLVDRKISSVSPPHPEGAARAGHVVARVLDVHELAQQGVAVHLVAHSEPHHAVDVLLRGAEPVDRRDGATTMTSRLVSSELVAEWRSRSTSSLIDESFSM